MYWLHFGWMLSRISSASLLRSLPLCKLDQYNHANEYIPAAHSFLAHGGNIPP